MSVCPEEYLYNLDWTTTGCLKDLPYCRYCNEVSECTLCNDGFVKINDACECMNGGYITNDKKCIKCLDNEIPYNSNCVSCSSF